MTEKVLTFAEVVADVAEIVQTRGIDYTDPRAGTGLTCSYEPAGEYKPCIVGAFWALNGVSPEQRAELDKHGSIVDVYDAQELPVLVTKKAFEFLRVCQREQDNSAKYGDMLSVALYKLARYSYDDESAYVSSGVPTVY